MESAGNCCLLILSASRTFWRWDNLLQRKVGHAALCCPQPLLAMAGSRSFLCLPSFQRKSWVMCWRQAGTGTNGALHNFTATLSPCKPSSKRRGHWLENFFWVRKNTKPCTQRLSVKAQRRGRPPSMSVWLAWEWKRKKKWGACARVLCVCARVPERGRGAQETVGGIYY